MRRIVLICFAAFLITLPLQAQGGWCGYALIEELPVLENQLAVIAAITPQKSERSQPHELFQYRYNLAHTAVIIEGCFQAEPRREVVVSLFEQVIDIPVELPKEQPPGDVIEVPVEIGEPVTPREYIESKLVYSLFAPGGTREESAASVRFYLQQNQRDWELEDV